MRSNATTVEQYLSELPEDRRAALSAVREVILKHLPKGIEEGMTYGMIGYYVPHRLYPAGYHCDPKQPLPFAGLASQKGHMSFYLMSLYGDPATEQWFREAWKAAGKKLDMGKCCVRFKKLEQVALDVLGKAIARVPVKEYIARIEKSFAEHRSKGSPSRKPVAKNKAKSKTNNR